MNKNLLARATLLAAPLLGGCDHQRQDPAIQGKQEVTRVDVDKALEPYTPPAIVKMKTESLSEEEALDKARSQLRRRVAEEGIANAEREQRINQDAADNSPYGYIADKKNLQTIDTTPTAFGAAELSELTNLATQQSESIATIMTTALGITGKKKAQSILVTPSQDRTTVTAKLTISFEWTTQLGVSHDVVVEGSFTKSGLTDFVVKRPGNYTLRESAAKDSFQGVFVPSTMVIVEKTVTYTTLAPAEEAAKVANAEPTPETGEGTEKPEEQKTKPLTTEAEIKPKMPMTQEAPKNGNSADDADTKPLSEEEILNKARAQFRVRLAEKGLEILTIEQSIKGNSDDTIPLMYGEDKKRLKAIDSPDKSGIFGKQERDALASFAETKGELLTNGIFKAMGFTFIGFEDKTKPVLVTLSEDGKIMRATLAISFRWTLQLNAPHDVTVEGSFSKSKLEQFSIKRPGNYPIKNEEAAKDFFQTVFVPAAVEMTEKTVKINSLSPIPQSECSAEAKNPQQSDQPAKEEK